MTLFIVDEDNGEAIRINISKWIKWHNEYQETHEDFARML